MIAVINNQLNINIANIHFLTLIIIILSLLLILILSSHACSRLNQLFLRLRLELSQIKSVNNNSRSYHCRIGRRVGRGIHYRVLQSFLFFILIDFLFLQLLSCCLIENCVFLYFYSFASQNGFTKIPQMASIIVKHNFSNISLDPDTFVKICNLSSTLFQFSSMQVFSNYLSSEQVSLTKDLISITIFSEMQKIYAKSKWYLFSTVWINQMHSFFQSFLLMKILLKWVASIVDSIPQSAKSTKSSSADSRFKTEYQGGGSQPISSMLNLIEREISSTVRNMTCLCSEREFAQILSSKGEIFKEFKGLSSQLKQQFCFQQKLGSPPQSLSCWLHGYSEQSAKCMIQQKY